MILSEILDSLARLPEDLSVSWYRVSRPGLDVERLEGLDASWDVLLLLLSY